MYTRIIYTHIGFEAIGVYDTRMQGVQCEAAVLRLAIRLVCIEGV